MSSVTFCSTTRFTDYRNRSWAAFAANGSGAPCGIAATPAQESAAAPALRGPRPHCAVRVRSRICVRGPRPHRGAEVRGHTTVRGPRPHRGAGNHGCRIPAFLHHFSLARRFFDEIPAKIHHFYPELPKYRRWRAKKLYNRRNFSASARFARKFLHFCTFQKLHECKQSLRKLHEQHQAPATASNHHAVWPRTSAPRSVAADLAPRCDR